MRITWWGHATVGIEDRGVRLLADPVLTDRLGHLVRRGGPTLPREARAADLVLVSHAHPDHLHMPSLALLERHTPVVVPRGLGPFVEHSTGRRALEVVPGDEVEIGDLRVHVVPADHDGSRGPWSSLRGTAQGFVVEGSQRAYVAGDTEIFDGMAEIGGTGLDVAVIPVGGWAPSLGPGHMDPVRAARSLELLAPRHAVPYHFGTLWPLGLRGFRDDLFTQPGKRFVATAAELAAHVRVSLLHPHGAVDVTTGEAWAPVAR